MSRLARPTQIAGDAGALSHERIWGALDALAARYGLSPSGLAKRAGLDATTFNRSKRRTVDGRLRWPSTESIAKVLDATGASLAEFLDLTGTRSAGAAGALPMIRSSQFVEGAEIFDGEGRPAQSGWMRTALPNPFDEQAFAIEISGETLLPAYRPGDVLVISPTAPIRPGDRILVKIKDREPAIAELAAAAEGEVELRELDASRSSVTIGADSVQWLKRIVWCSQ